MNYQWLIGVLFSATFAVVGFAHQLESTDTLRSHTGFFRVNYDPFIRMPQNLSNINLVGINYFADVTPDFYAGIGGYGAVAGTQGGLFTVGAGGGVHHEIASKLWGDLGLFVGGGGGKSSLTGGGLMIKPQIGLAYDLPFGRLGVYYSYIDFPNGEVRSQQIGFNLDLPVEVGYLTPNDERLGEYIKSSALNKFIHFQHNDFMLLAQAYEQREGTLNTLGEVQDNTIGLLGAQFEHYLSDHTFWWLKTSGALHGIPNGYMDVIGGLGYHLSLGDSAFSLVPQMGLGAGGGGLVETGGGFLVSPNLGLEWGLSQKYSLRISSGYLWSPQGNLRVVPITGELIYHLDVAAPAETGELGARGYTQGWRMQVLNQTYTHPQRSFSDITSSIQLIAIQIDQLFNPTFFMTYQGAGAYVGYHAGGYASGMIGPGLQTPMYFNHHWQGFAELLIGAGGGGGLALSGGALIEPLIGVRYALSPEIGVQFSAGDLKALRDDLNTPIINIGLTVRFDMLNS